MDLSFLEVHMEGESPSCPASDKDQLILKLRTEADARRLEIGQFRAALAWAHTQEGAARKCEEDVGRLQAEVQARREEVRRLRETLLGPDLGNDEALDTPRPLRRSLPASVAHSQRHTIGSTSRRKVEPSSLARPRPCSNGNTTRRTLPPAAFRGTLVHPSGMSSDELGTPAQNRVAQQPHIEHPPWTPPGKHGNPLDVKAIWNFPSELSRQSSRCPSPRLTPPASRETSPTPRQQCVDSEPSPRSQDFSSNDTAIPEHCGVRGNGSQVSGVKSSPRRSPRLSGSRSRSTSREDQGRHCFLVPLDEVKPPASPGQARSVVRPKVFVMHLGNSSNTFASESVLQRGNNWGVLESQAQGSLPSSGVSTLPARQQSPPAPKGAAPAVAATAAWRKGRRTSPRSGPGSLCSDQTSILCENAEVPATAAWRRRASLTPPASQCAAPSEASLRAPPSEASQRAAPSTAAPSEASLPPPSIRLGQARLDPSHLVEASQRAAPSTPVKGHAQMSCVQSSPSSVGSTRTPMSKMRGFSPGGAASTMSMSPVSVIEAVSGNSLRVQPSSASTAEAVETAFRGIAVASSAPQSRRVSLGQQSQGSSMLLAPQSPSFNQTRDLLRLAPTTLPTAIQGAVGQRSPVIEWRPVAAATVSLNFEPPSSLRLPGDLSQNQAAPSLVALGHPAGHAVTASVIAHMPFVTSVVAPALPVAPSMASLHSASLKDIQGMSSASTTVSLVPSTGIQGISSSSLSMLSTGIHGVL